MSTPANLLAPQVIVCGVPFIGKKKENARLETGNESHCALPPPPHQGPPPHVTPQLPGSTNREAHGAAPIRKFPVIHSWQRKQKRQLHGVPPCTWMGNLGRETLPTTREARRTTTNPPPFFSNNNETLCRVLQCCHAYYTQCE